jgi:hypothetical protein
MDDLLIGFVVGLVAGTASSLLIWILTTLFITSNIYVCKEIAESIQSDEKVYYYIKIINDAWLRNAFDVSFSFRIYYEGAFVKPTEPNVPDLYSKNCETKKKYSYERAIQFDLQTIPETRIAHASNPLLIQSYSEKKLRLKDFFSTNSENNTYVEVVVTAYDSFTKSRKSKVIKFKQEAITPGEFKDGERHVTSINPKSKTPIEQ